MSAVHYLISMFILMGDVRDERKSKKTEERLLVDQYSICVEKSLLVMESCQQNEGEPEILRRAKATANYLDQKTIFIEEDELIVDSTAKTLK